MNGFIWPTGAELYPTPALSRKRALGRGVVGAPTQPQPGEGARAAMEIDE